MTAGEQVTDLDGVRGEGGPVSLQISNIVGHIHKELVGRGPTRVRTHVNEELIVCVLEGGFTRAEQTVWEHAGKLPVVENRLRLQDAMRQAVVEAVEEIVGRPIRSFMSCNDPAQDLQAEVMILGQNSAPDRP